MVLHAIGTKPWVLLWPQDHWSGYFMWFRRLMQEISPFVAHARRYRDRVGESMGWLDYRTPTGTVLKLLGCGQWAFRGLPITLALTLAKRFGLV